MNASDLMTQNPVHVGPDAAVADVWDLMREMDVRHVPVVDGGELIGIVSDRDLAHLDVTSVLRAGSTDALRQALSVPAVHVMSADFIAIDTETDLADAIDLLIEHKVGALPVLRPASRKLVGILSYIDVLRALVDGPGNAG